MSKLNPILGLCVISLGCAIPKPAPTTLIPYHQGPWEQTIGYSQSITAGNRIHVSGTVGADASGFPKTMEGQMKAALATIEATLKQQGGSLQDVVAERIYTTDIEALKRCQDVRKQAYSGHLPAATWVEVRRLYEPEALREIEVEALRRR